MSEPQPKHWIKMPGPGEFRGSGEWYAVEDNHNIPGLNQKYWQDYHDTGFLPVKVSVEKPDATKLGG